VKIHSSHHVISASTDGLVAVHDMSGGLKDDDDNFKAALNVGTSVEEVGLYGDEEERLWVRTGTETLQLWEWRLAALDDREGGDEAFAIWAEARAMAVEAASGGTAGSALSEVDYLVGCTYDPGSHKLSLIAGTNGGTAAFFPLNEQRQGGAAGTSAPLSGAIMAPPILLLQGAHSDVVRSVRCFGNFEQVRSAVFIARFTCTYWGYVNIGGVQILGVCEYEVVFQTDCRAHFAYRVVRMGAFVSGH
jgi:hypothetical protein